MLARVLDMLHLASTTGAAWLTRALAHLDEILVDHAHCEKKAASTAVSLLFRYPERAELLAPLARLAREELRHFEQVLAHLAAARPPARPPAPEPVRVGAARGRASPPSRSACSTPCSAWR